MSRSGFALPYHAIKDLFRFPSAFALTGSVAACVILNLILRTNRS